MREIADSFGVAALSGIAGIVGATLLIWVVRWLASKKIPLWIWRRFWGRDEHGVYLTPSVRGQRLIVAAVEPQHAALRESITDLRADSTREHAVVVASVRDLSERVTALETAVKDAPAAHTTNVGVVVTAADTQSIIDHKEPS